MTRTILLAIFTLGLTAQFIRPLNDALQEKSLLGGALLSLVAYIMYDAIQDLGRESRRSVEPLSIDTALDAAFKSRSVAISFIGYTSETFFSRLAGQLGALRNDPGTTRSINVRILIPDLSRETGLPCRMESNGTFSDDAEFRGYLFGKAADHARLLTWLTRLLNNEGIIHCTIEFRLYPGIPMCKLYVLNGGCALLGLYQVDSETEFPYEEPDRVLLDPKGGQVTMHAWEKSDGTQESENAVGGCARFFDGLWKISRVPEWP
ncbi:hypothetical protein [Streptomyces spectabilis]|uniref:Uncharacterized protein n=1 Tax=Streptomyces spectabilis TaxID=68270 RepID=A0A516RHS5_STRST|nr:hypothetical protein [Streptomyces spectabilis]QDQ15194.1 hypothetical protein FH965_35400 [Streptomyces spectabilis]